MPDPDTVPLEFFPEIIFEIPKCPDGCCCLKPVVTQSKRSRKMYILAQHIQWKYKHRLDLIIPSKTDSRIIPVKKFKQFKADLRIKRLGIQKLPALVLAGRVICEGKVPGEDEIEKIVEKILSGRIVVGKWP